LTALKGAVIASIENARMTRPHLGRALHELPRTGWLRVLALALFIPAFYALWTGEGAIAHLATALWLGAAAVLMLAARAEERAGLRQLDLLLAVLACATVLSPDTHHWPGWMPRLAVATALAVRVVLDIRVYLRRDRLWLLLVAAGSCWLLGGVGFYWLDPKVHNVADGLWLAFTTGATVGYGDLTPTVGSSRVLALFVVLVGYTFLSLVTAAMVTALLGREERLQMQALHRDIAALRSELQALRRDLARQEQPGALSVPAAPWPADVPAPQPDRRARTHDPAPGPPPAGP
jgi:voltage-gated potassium channel